MSAFLERAGRASWLCLAVGALACSWDRFDQLRTNAPVENLERATDRALGFGTSLSAGRSGDTVMLLVGGPESGGIPAGVYSLGTAEKPTPEAYDDDHCLPSPEGKVCSQIEQGATLPRGVAGGQPRDFCFISGIGRAGSREGLWTRCIDFFEDVYLLPDDVKADFVTPLLAGQRLPELRLATSREEAPPVLAGAPEAGRAWIYPSLDNQPIDVVPNGTASAGFGKSVAVVGSGADTLLAVGSSESGAVWFFGFDGTVVEPRGCLAGAPGFGSLLGSGDLDGDGPAELVVADGKKVYVFEGAALAALPASAATTCDPALLPQRTELICAANADTTGCAAAQFGHALTVADLDGDGAAEVAVGAPNMSVREVPGAGAVLIYDAAGRHIDTRILSEALEGTRFGSSLAPVSQGQPGAAAARDVLAVGAPGDQRTTVVYCATVAGSGISPRCE